MGLAADISEYGREHGILDFMEAFHMFMDPGPNHWDSPSSETRARMARSRSRERRRKEDLELRREQQEIARRRSEDLTHAVIRECISKGHTRAQFLAACEILGIEDPLVVAESGEDIVRTIFDRLDAEAHRQNASRDELVQKKLAPDECVVSPGHS